MTERDQYDEIQAAIDTALAEYAFPAPGAHSLDSLRRLLFERMSALHDRLVKEHDEAWRPHWQADTVGAPKGAVLVWCPERRNIYTAIYRNGTWHHFADGGEPVRQLVTHWVETPDPPKEDR